MLSGIVAHGGATVNGLSRRDGVSHTRDHRLPLPHHDARLPAAEGNYYRTLAPALPATRMLGQWTREIRPLIYTEMSRRMIEADASTLLAEMSLTGVTQAVVVAIDPFVPTSEVLDACRHLPGLLLPFGSCDPSGDYYPERFTQLLTEPIVGIKFHSDLQRLPLDSPRLRVMLRLLAQSDRLHLPVYLHTGNFPIYEPLETPWHVALPRLLAEFPALTFVCGHSGWDAPARPSEPRWRTRTCTSKRAGIRLASSDACVTNWGPLACCLDRTTLCSPSGARSGTWRQRCPSWSSIW